VQRSPQLTRRCRAFADLAHRKNDA
jgi:hypothetical protein